MVTKNDCYNLKPMPQETEHFTLKMQLSETDLTMLKEGYRPKEMEDKWFMYYENNKFYFHRSWSGICIYIVSDE